MVPDVLQSDLWVDPSKPAQDKEQDKAEGEEEDDEDDDAGEEEGEEEQEQKTQVLDNVYKGLKVVKVGL